MNTKAAKKTPNKNIKPVKGLRLYNVYYTPIPYEVEMVIRAKSMEAAVATVKNFLGNTVESVKGGWELDPKTMDGSERVPTSGEIL